MYHTVAIDVAADTPVQVAGPSGAPVSSKSRTATLKLAFQFTSTPGVVVFGESSAIVASGDGFPSFADADTLQASTDDLNLVPNDEVWVQATEAGRLYVQHV